MYGRLYGPIGATFRHLVNKMEYYKHPVGYNEWYSTTDQLWRLKIFITYNHQLIHFKVFESTDIDVLYNQVNGYLASQVQALQQWK